MLSLCNYSCVQIPKSKDEDKVLLATWGKKSLLDTVTKIWNSDALTI